MEENYIKLLKMALSIGWEVVNQIRYTLDYCEDARNDYYKMLKIVGEKIGVDLDDCY